LFDQRLDLLKQHRQVGARETHLGCGDAVALHAAESRRKKHLSFGDSRVRAGGSNSQRCPCDMGTIQKFRDEAAIIGQGSEHVAVHGIQ
jgi:hypothetical protein